jgi:hypothetical protein
VADRSSPTATPRQDSAPGADFMNLFRP